MAVIYIDFDVGDDGALDASNPNTPVATWVEAQSRVITTDHSRGGGDTIKCLSSWADPIPLGIKAGITYAAADSGTEIDATGESIAVQLYSNQTLSGAWNIHSASSHGIQGYPTGIANRSVYIEDLVYVHDCGGDGIRVQTTGSTIERVKSVGNAGIGINCLEADCIISVALVVGNGGGVKISGSSAVMEHITLFANGNNLGYSISVSSGATVRNCISQDNPTSYGIGLDLDNVSHCWIYSSDRDEYHTIGDFYDGVVPVGCGTTDPMLTDPDSGDFTIQTNSPCIAIGTPGLATIDLVGNEYGSTPSMGAFEFIDSRQPWEPDVSNLNDIAPDFTIHPIKRLADYSGDNVYTQPPFILRSKDPAVSLRRKGVIPYKVER